MWTPTLNGQLVPYPRLLILWCVGWFVVLVLALFEVIPMWVAILAILCFLAVIPISSCLEKPWSDLVHASQSRRQVNDMAKMMTTPNVQPLKAPLVDPKLPQGRVVMADTPSGTFPATA